MQWSKCTARWLSMACRFRLPNADNSLPLRWNFNYAEARRVGCTLHIRHAGGCATWSLRHHVQQRRLNRHQHRYESHARKLRSEVYHERHQHVAPSEDCEHHKLSQTDLHSAHRCADKSRLHRIDSVCGNKICLSKIFCC